MPLTESQLRALLPAIVFAAPGSDKYDIRRLLHERGYGLFDVRFINRALYGATGLEWRLGTGSRRLWYPAVAGTTAQAQSTIVAPSRDLALYPWQKNALNAWREHGHRGVVEAVTGAGKTRLAMAATAKMLREGGRVAIVVPSKDLMRQWVSELREQLMNVLRLHVSVGTMGDGTSADLNNCQVLVATAQSGYRWELQPPPKSLLVADECHHYGAEKWSRVLEPGFLWRLGLTATYEREDNGVHEYLASYFGDVCYSLDYLRAREEDVIAKFKLAFIGVAFEPEEQRLYDEEEQKAARLRAKLINEWGLPAEPFGEFMKAVCGLNKAGETFGSKLAGHYLSAFTKRRKVLAEARQKMLKIRQLAAAVRAAERTIAFAQTKEAAAAIVDVLSESGLSGSVLTSDMNSEERSRVFAAFEDGRREIVAAPKLLDEGIDVPAADLALIVASSRSKRQLIQRMGRVVRKKKDGRLARIAILYVQGTSEDPESGAHQDFLEDITVAAESTQIFRPGVSNVAILSYLNSW